MRCARWIAGLTLLTVSFVGCVGLSNEERCKKQGGVWKGTYCEMQSR